MGKNAVVLGGGGAKGSYEIGVFNALLKLNYKYDIITGTSVGSINGAVIAQGDISVAKKMWRKISTNNVLDLKTKISKDNPLVYKIMAKELMENNGFDYTNLKALLEKVIDEEKLLKSPVDFGLVTVKFPSMKPLYIFKKDMEKGKIIDYILASAACFPAMKPHKIGKEKYIDGGYTDNLPINMAIEKGAKNIVAVDLNALGMIRKIKNKNVNIIYINSYSDLGNMLIFDSNRAEKNIKLGYFDTFKAFGKLDGYKYTFKKGELYKDFINLYPVLSRFLKEYFKGDLAKFTKIIKQIVIKTYKSRLKENVPFNNEVCLSMILESTMEAFSLSPYEIYSVKKARNIIKIRFKKIKKDDISSLHKLISNTVKNKDFIKNAEKIRELAKSIDSKQIINYIFNLFDSELNSKRGILLLLLVCMPSHFFSALYIRAILTK